MRYLFSVAFLLLLPSCAAVRDGAQTVMAAPIVGLAWTLDQVAPLRPGPATDTGGPTTYSVFDAHGTRLGTVRAGR